MNQIMSNVKCTLLVYPSKCSLDMVAINDETMRSKSVEFWDNVYGGLLCAINFLNIILKHVNSYS